MIVILVLIGQSLLTAWLLFVMNKLHDKLFKEQRKTIWFYDRVVSHEAEIIRLMRQRKILAYHLKSLMTTVGAKANTKKSKRWN